MSRNFKKKMGMTLLEVIISIAIIGIMLIPISNIILTSVKVNKNGEDKQQAVYLAQQVVDGLKNVSSFENARIILNNDNSNGLQINAAGTSGSISIGSYRVNVSIGRKSQDISYSNNGTSASYDEQIEISRDDSNRTFSLGATTTSISENKNDIYIYIDSSTSEGKAQYNVAVKNSNTETASNIFSDTRSTFNNKINLNFNDLYKSDNNFNIHVKNNLESQIDFYVTVPIDRVYKDGDSRAVKYSVVNEGGLVNVYNASEGNASIFRKNYDVKVDVLKQDKLIYSMNSNVAK
ncbi:prepilin-type N-terminal cleavage/methylation domain-containing protein [Clostridium sp. C8-1-8]|uniref:prepilin-type N-terminal cleavage/methylation domain-containing protein n=1 Tax=Clostridium sp. C8-1-8 TaxID=2698831 RepID=UPI00136CA0B3|nr:prepilin-type N-terminal cleavage/methylation domain-containing protein [Clostridium sp. C8-1-8]